MLFSFSTNMSSCYYRRIPNPTISIRRPRLHLRRPISISISLSANELPSSSTSGLRWRRTVTDPAADRFGVRKKLLSGIPVECRSALGGEDHVDLGGRRKEVAAAAAATVVLGTGNRVLYKLALVPLKKYPFFLAQIATFGYVVVYFSILYFRYHAGIVTDEMLSLPKTPFIAVGLLEALGAASGMAAGAVLSGASIPILSQTFLIWQLILSGIFLGRQYRTNQILGCFLVAVGVVITVASGSDAGLSLQNAGMFWTLLMITSFFFQAADTVLKEIIFVNAAKKLKGGSVDIFVVNSFGSAFQALFICLLLPLLSRLWGVPFSQLPSYIKDGAACFLNIGSSSNVVAGCEGAPMLPLLFVLVNMAFNISLLHLLKISSAVVSSLASTFSVPLSIYAFTLPLPYIGVASSLPRGFMMGAGVLLAGLLSYSWTPSSTPASQCSSSSSSSSSISQA